VKYFLRAARVEAFQIPDSKRFIPDQSYPDNAHRRLPAELFPEWRLQGLRRGRLAVGEIRLLGGEGSAESQRSNSLFPAWAEN